jgi:hypothetical protein
MRHSLIVTAFAAAASLASSANAGAPEARNPFHCSIALQVAYDLVEQAQGADSELAREVHGRLVWQAFAAAHFPKATDSEGEAESLRGLFTADREAGLAMAEACMIRQDAHPRFRAARLDRQIRDGFDKQRITARATLVELKQYYRGPASAPESLQR